MNNIPQWSCEKFAQETFSAAPFPGGGGVSAFIAALGTALGGMVCNLTAGKPAYAEYEKEILKIRTQAESLKDSLMAQIDADAENFYPLSQCYKMPEETEAQKLEKHNAMQAALKTAVLAPVEIIKLSAEAIRLHEILMDKGSKLALSDVGCGVIALRAAIESAWLNVLINIKFMDDKAYVYELKNELLPLMDEAYEMADFIAQSVAKRLSPVAQRDVKNLALVRVGARPADISFEKALSRASGAAGYRVSSIVLPEDCSFEDFEKCVKQLNTDDEIDRIEICRPIDNIAPAEAILGLVAPEKNAEPTPAAAKAIFGLVKENIKAYTACESLASANICIINNSPLVGRPLALMFMEADASVSVFNKYSDREKLASACRNADVIVVAVPEESGTVVDGAMLSENTILVDAGLRGAASAEAVEKASLYIGSSAVGKETVAQIFGCSRYCMSSLPRKIR